MSMLRKSASMASLIRSRSACVSAAGSAAYFLALAWKWSPWMKMGPS